MTPANLKSDFRSFFLKNESGKYYVEKLNEMIHNNHELAEKQPTLARDYSQRAKGMRQALDLINSITAERKMK